MECIKRAAVPLEFKDSEFRAKVVGTLADIATRGEAQRGGLRKCVPGQGWDFDVYDKKRND